jgi:hypothetical protein
MDPQLASGIVAGLSALLAAGMGFWANDRLDRRQRREARELRNLDEKIRIAQDIIAANSSLVEYLNDHKGQFDSKQLDKLTSADLTEVLELWRVMNRAHKRARIYFLPSTVELIERRLRGWQVITRLGELPAGERRLAMFRSIKSRSGDEMEAALRRELGL